MTRRVFAAGLGTTGLATVACPGWGQESYPAGKIFEFVAPFSVDRGGRARRAALIADLLIADMKLGAQ